MSRRSLPQFRARAGLVALVAAGLLAGCDELSGSGGAASTGGEARAGGVLRVQERDVERPDIFDLEARGLWDGRPSLGGRWVAVAQDINADRVRITNLDNNRQIEGALFKVEAGRPGPPIMVSSEAAEPLGMLPGAPARLHVVVVRKEATEVVEAPAEAPADGAAVATGSVAGAAAAGDAVAPLDTGALETTVLGALDGAEPAPAPKPAAEPAAEATPAAAPAPAPADQTELNALVAATAAPAGIGEALKLPYLQVASGGSKDAADTAVRKLNDEGYGASIRETTSNGKPFFRVVAGPFGNQGGRSNALKRIRELGYKDAFPVK